MANDLLSRDEALVWHPFSPLKNTRLLPAARAQGNYIELTDGRKLFDAISSWWVNLHGHNHPAIVRAIQEQAAKMQHIIFAGFTHEPAVQLAERIEERLPAGSHRYFFSDNGSTATEVALKLAVQYFHNRGATRQRILAFRGAYHGDTFGAMAVSGDSVFHRPFRDMLFEVCLLDPPATGDVGKTLGQLRHHLRQGPIAAFIYEPLVMGAGGMKMLNPADLSQLLAKAREEDILLIADEVMTGFGRTGTLFASEQCAPWPDLLCLSKGITGGALPLGLSVVGERIWRAFDSADREKTFLHGHSYTGNPLACAAAVASWDVTTQNATEARIAAISAAQADFAGRIRAAQCVELYPRHKGTLLALDLPSTDAGYLSQRGPEIYSYFLERDLLIRPLGNTLYLMPPYTATAEELQRCYNAIETFLRQEKLLS